MGDKSGDSDCRANRMPALRYAVDRDEQVAGKQWCSHGVNPAGVPTLFEVARQIYAEALPLKVEGCLGFSVDVSLGDVPALRGRYNVLLVLLIRYRASVVIVVIGHKAVHCRDLYR